MIPGFSIIFLNICGILHKLSSDYAALLVKGATKNQLNDLKEFLDNHNLLQRVQIILLRITLVEMLELIHWILLGTACILALAGALYFIEGSFLNCTF